MRTKGKRTKIVTTKGKRVDVVCDYCDKPYTILESSYYKKMHLGLRYFYCTPKCAARALAERIYERQGPKNIPDELKRVYEDIPLLPEDMIGKCYYCHCNIRKSEIFCRKHATKENLTIFEATQELPVHPRGWWSYNIIKDWLAGEKQILLKAPAGTGKSLLEDMIAYMNLTLNDGSFTLIGSISMPIAVQHIDRIREWVNRSPFRGQITYDSKEQIKLNTGARVLAIAQNEKTRGGYHPDLLLLDELARIRPAAYYGLFYQMGKSKGACHIGVSTPFLGCYDDQTEVLTENGFKLFKYVNSDEQIATMNLESEELEYQSFTKKFEYDYDGDLIEIDAKGINLRITPNHNIYFKTDYAYRNGGSYSNCSADEIESQYIRNIPKVPLPSEGIEIPFLGVTESKIPMRNGHGEYIKTDTAKKIPMDLWLEYLGYFLSEGSIDKNGTRVQISQKKFRDKMFTCCRKISEHFNRKGGETDIKFRIQSPQLYSLLKGKKCIPDYVYKCSLRQRKIFLDALSLGDGSQQAERNGTWLIYLNALTEKQLVDDLQRLLVTMGIPTTMSYRRGSLAQVFGNSKRFGNIRPNRDKSISRIPYNGKVYCFELPNHTMIVRRQGKVSISGNSGPFIHLWYSNTAKNYPVTLKDCWFISDDAVKLAQKAMSPSYFDQVFKAEFVATSNRVISDEQVLNAITDKSSKKSNGALMGIDFGRKRDNTAIVILNSIGEVIYTEIFPLKISWREQYAMIRERVKRFDPIRIFGDATSMGDVILEELIDLHIEPVLMSNDKLKKRLIDNLLLCFSYNSIRIPKNEESLIDQLSSYVYFDDNLIKCGPEGGTHDDLVDALMFCASGLERGLNERETGNVWGAVSGQAKSSSGEEGPWKLIW